MWAWMWSQAPSLKTALRCGRTHLYCGNRVREISVCLSAQSTWFVSFMSVSKKITSTQGMTQDFLLASTSIPHTYAFTGTQIWRCTCPKIGRRIREMNNPSLDSFHGAISIWTWTLPSAIFPSAQWADHGGNQIRTRENKAGGRCQASFLHCWAAQTRALFI